MKFTMPPIQDLRKPAAVMVFIVTLILFIMQLLNIMQLRAPAAQIVPPIKTDKKTDAISKNSPLFTWPLFGDYVSLTTEDVKQSTLDFEVAGVLYSTDSRSSRVLIRVAEGEEKSYFIGDTLPGGAVIKRIDPRGVIVLHNGAMESLSLPKNGLLFSKPAKPLIEE